MRWSGSTDPSWSWRSWRKQEVACSVLRLTVYLTSRQDCSSGPGTHQGHTSKQLGFSAHSSRVRVVHSVIAAAREPAQGLKRRQKTVWRKPGQGHVMRGYPVIVHGAHGRGTATLTLCESLTRAGPVELQGGSRRGEAQGGKGGKRGTETSVAALKSAGMTCSRLPLWARMHASRRCSTIELLQPCPALGNGHASMGMQVQAQYLPYLAQVIHVVGGQAGNGLAVAIEVLRAQVWGWLQGTRMDMAEKGHSCELSRCSVAQVWYPGALLVRRDSPWRTCPSFASTENS